MKQHSIFIFLLFGCTLLGLAQEETMPPEEIDSLYREDQFYLGLNYNLLIDKPKGIKNEGFSGGIYAGFLRDMPINKRRNVAIAAGFGYAYNYYGHNLFAGQNDTGEMQYIALNSDYSYTRNRFVTHEVEFPLEFRWRTSTPTSYKFWRVYAGVKFSYVFYYNSKYMGEETILVANIPDFNRLRAGLTLSLGWNTFNFQAYYGLNPFFNDDAKIDGENVNLNTLRIGIIFYIL